MVGLSKWNTVICYFKLLSTAIYKQSATIADKKGKTCVAVFKKIAHKGNGIIRRCGFVRLGVVLLKKVCYCGGRL